jgi:hypothetical protein
MNSVQLQVVEHVEIEDREVGDVINVAAGVGGAEAWMVAATTKSGRTISEYFDVNSGLRLGTVTTTPMGPQTAIFKDYKEFDKKKVATTLVQRSAQGDVILTSQIVTFGVPDAAYFKQP